MTNTLFSYLRKYSPPMDVLLLVLIVVIDPSPLSSTGKKVIITLSISAISFVYCLRVLWQVFCTIIKLKSEEEEEKMRRANRLFRFIPTKA